MHAELNMCTDQVDTFSSVSQAKRRAGVARRTRKSGTVGIVQHAPPIRSLHFGTRKTASKRRNGLSLPRSISRDHRFQKKEYRSLSDRQPLAQRLEPLPRV